MLDPPSNALKGAADFARLLRLHNQIFLQLFTQVAIGNILHQDPIVSNGN